MMQTLSSLIRHGVTYVVGMLTAWLAVNLTGPDIAEATAAAEALIEPVVVIAGFVAVILARLAMPVFNKISRMGSGENDDDDRDHGSKPGGVMLLLIAGTVAGLCLPPCSSALAETQDFKTQDAREDFQEGGMRLPMYCRLTGPALLGL